MSVLSGQKGGPITAESIMGLMKQNISAKFEKKPMPNFKSV